MAEPRWGPVRVFASVRARTTLVGVVVVGAALAIGSLGLVTLLRSSMTEGVETTARAQLDDVVSLLRLGQLPAQLPIGRGDTFTQVVSERGTVVATSATLLASSPISRSHPGEEGVVIDTIPTLTGTGPGGAADADRTSHGAGAPDADGPFLLLAEQVPASPGLGPSGPVTVYVAATLHPVVAATHTVASALSAGLPVLLVIVAGLIWFLEGRALRPVEAIRAEVADISGHDLHRRVPEPATGDEVAQLARTMNSMLDRLEASSDAQRRFAADASHELRSPLSAIQATLEVALAHPDPQAWPAAAADALDEATRLRRLVDDLLDLAKAGQPGGTARREEVDLDEVVARAARPFRVDGRVTLDMHKVSAGKVIGDPDQLARLVHNLLDNARRHARSRISVELSATSESVLLVVGDDGPGIPEEERNRIFERFARLDEGRDRDSGGTGLGLAIVKEIVVAHGGRVTVGDSLSGARFEIRFPPAPDDDQPLDRPAPRE